MQLLIMTEISFKDTKSKYEVDDQICKILLILYEIEMHLKAILYISKEFHNNSIVESSLHKLWLTHDTCALIKSQILYKCSTGDDEIKSIYESGKLVPTMEYIFTLDEKLKKEKEKKKNKQKQKINKDYILDVLLWENS